MCPLFAFGKQRDLRARAREGKGSLNHLKTHTRVGRGGSGRGGCARALTIIMYWLVPSSASIMRASTALEARLFSSGKETMPGRSVMLMLRQLGPSM